MDMKDYILVTPCKNEQDSLPKLIDLIRDQSIVPSLWVIVDDGSDDNSQQIIENATGTYKWIKSIRLTEKPRDLGIHVSEVYRAGFDYAISYAHEKSIQYEYIGVVDADLFVEKDYFAFLITELEKNPKLGICSGHVGNMVDGKIIWSVIRHDLPNGGARLWRKECFEDTGGYAVTCSPDSVSNVKAKVSGWDTRQFGEVTAISIRPYASAQGQWFGYKKLGKNNYYIGYTPLHVLLKAATLLYSRNGYTSHGMGLAYAYGYFQSYISRKPKLQDEEVLQYNKNNWLRDYSWSKKFQNGKK
jgi:glycosyltransferase involved in cell wall biosynthesis